MSDLVAGPQCLRSILIAQGGFEDFWSCAHRRCAAIVGHAFFFELPCVHALKEKGLGELGHDAMVEKEHASAQNQKALAKVKKLGYALLDARHLAQNGGVSQS